MADPVRRRLAHAVRNPHTGAVRGPVWLSLAALVTGVGTYALLIIVARALGAHLYADFAVYWSFVVISSFGVFLPLEQELARRTARAPGDAMPFLRQGLLLGGALSVVVLVVGGLSWATAFRSIPFDPLLATAVVVLAASFGVQFSSRGVLSGRLQLRDYAAVLGVDTVTRLVAVAVVATAGVGSVGPYALCIAGSAGAAAGVGWWRATRTSDRPVQSTKASEPGSLVHKVAGLIVGAAAMQLLLNSGPLIARGLAAPGELVLAGTLLATMTLARVPVFLQQSMQASYLARLAGHAHRGERRALHRTLALLLGIGATLGLATVLLSGILGPWLVELIYGPTFVITRLGAVLVAAGVAAYLLAGICNDCTIALDRHRMVAIAWLAAAAVALLCVISATTLLLRSTVPLIAGACLAGLVLGTTVWRSASRVGSGHPRGPLTSSGAEGAA